MKFLVFIEQRDGKIRKASLEALSLAARLAGGPVSAVIAGKAIGEAAKELGKFGAAKVYVADRDDLALYSNRGYGGALQAAREKESPDAVLIAATSMGKDLAPRFAAKNDAGVLADVMDLRVEGDRLVGVRPVYSGKARATVEAASGLRVATTRPNVFPAEKNDGAAEPAIEALDLGALEIRARVTGITASGGKELDVTEADVVVSGGRGIKGPEGWPIIRDLVDAMGSGAALGASRAVVDAGWIDHQYQVGQTGKVVSPTLYVACGISGAIQHLAGMGTSKVIVAINKDADAPIFKVATYGVVADLFPFVPELAKAVRAIKSE
ncbi:MAG TPA: electron transfer flavoprotein subunit alpha/FixB family protein [Thermoanaerobaculia bacterium]|nr:electron transfer flavoprotein subunit alpha/FixB family protein [Thermoanaerobaculia bacterium]